MSALCQKRTFGEMTCETESPPRSSLSEIRLGVLVRRPPRPSASCTTARRGRHQRQNARKASARCEKQVWLVARPREFLREVHRHTFWQVETRQFPIPIGQSKPNAETLVERPINRNGYIKVCAAVLRIEQVCHALPKLFAAKGAARPDGGDGLVDANPLPSRSSNRSGLNIILANSASATMAPTRDPTLLVPSLVSADLPVSFRWASAIW